MRSHSHEEKHAHAFASARPSSRVQPLNLAVQGDVDRDRRQLHAEKVDERGDDDEQAIGSAQCPNAKYSRRDQRQHRTDPHEDKQRLIVLDDAIDHVKRSNEAATSRLLMPGITTAAKANRKPATNEHRNVASTNTA